MNSNQSSNAGGNQPTDPPPSEPSSKQEWAERLNRLGLAGIAGALIDASAPLAPLIGQLLYIAQPTLGLFVSRRSVATWAAWLDQPENVRAFAESLDEPPHSPR